MEETTGTGQESAAPQMVYEAQGVPAEMPSDKRGKTYAMLSIICAVLALMLVSIVFGVVGILLGKSAMQKGHHTLGLVGVILSSVFMVLGMIIGAAVGVMRETGMFGGILALIFS